jgi:hypothetical protein
MKIIVFWNVALRSLVESDWCFDGVYFLHHQDYYRPNNEDTKDL